MGGGGMSVDTIVHILLKICILSDLCWLEQYDKPMCTNSIENAGKYF